MCVRSAPVVRHPMVPLALAFVCGRACPFACSLELSALLLGVSIFAERTGVARFLVATALMFLAGSTWPNPEPEPCSNPTVPVRARVTQVRVVSPGARQSVDLRVGAWKVRASLAPAPIVQVGDQIVSTLDFRAFSTIKNPSDFDGAAWALRRGYSCRARSISAHGWVHRRRFLRGWSEYRQSIYHRLSRLREPSRSVVRALALGERVEMDPILRDRWSRAGIAHLLAISGLHVTLVAGFTWFCIAVSMRALARFGLALSGWRRLATLGGAGSATLYTLWVGAPTSAIRASAMLLMLALSQLLSDRLHPLDALAVVLLALVLIDGNSVYDIGLWLSVTAVAALVAGRGWLEALIAPAIANASIVAAEFRSIAWVSPLANAVAIPLSSFIMTPLALLVAVLPPMGVLDAVLMAIVDGMNWGASLGALGESACSGLSGGLVVIMTSFGVASAWLRGTLRWSLRLAVLVTLLWAALPEFRPANRPLRVQYLSVGQGDSTLVRLPSGESWLIDSGGLVGPGRFDPGARHVVPALLDAGVRRLDAVVATHGDSDHIRGLHAVIDRFHIGKLYWNGRDTRAMQRVLEHARAKEVPIEIVRRVVHWSGSSRIELRVWGSASNENDASVVTVIQDRKIRLVFPGDISADAEMKHAEWVGDVDVLLAAHHGSQTSSCSPWLDRLRPEHVVISVGQGNRYKMPHIRALERIGSTGAEIWRLDLGGQVQVRSDDNEFCVGFGLRRSRCVKR